MENNPELPAAEVKDRTTVIELLEEFKKQHEEHALRYHASAELNERMCNGDQFIEIGEGFELGPAEWGADVPKISRNLLRNLRLTWSSRILEDRPSVQFFPGQAGVDQYRTKIAEKVFEQLRQTNDFDDLCFRAAELVQPHSAVAFKTYWDPLKGPLSDDGRPLGDVCWQIVSIFDYATDGSEDIEDSKWVYFHKYVDKDDAYELLDAAGIEEEPQEDEYIDLWGIKKRGVKLYELWIRPNSYRFPNGLYAVIIGNQVIEARDFPYNHGELPLSVWKCGARRNSPYGSTHVDDAVPLQRLINECVAALSKQARLISTIKLLAHPDIINKWEHGHQRIPTPDVQMAQYARYLEPPNRSEVLVTTLEDTIEALYAVFGLNEMLTGAESLKSGTAAKSIAYINKLDSMKMAGAARNLAKAILRMVKHSLKLVQQYVVAERLLKIAGAGNEMPVEFFRGADIAGVDVIVQPGSAIEGMRASIANNANTQMQQAGPTPELQFTAQTGLKDSAYTESQRGLVFEQIKGALAGQPIQANPEIDANIAVDVLNSLMGQVNPQAQQVLVQMMQLYKQNVQQQMQKESADDLAIKTAGGMQ